MYPSGPTGSSPVHHRARTTVPSTTNGGGGGGGDAGGFASPFSYSTTNPTPQAYGYYNAAAIGTQSPSIQYDSTEGLKPISSVSGAVFPTNIGAAKGDDADMFGLFDANYRVASMYIPTFCFIFGRPESAVPLKVFALTLLVVYGLDLANLSSASGWVLWTSCLIQTFLTIGYGYFGSSDNSADDVEGMGPFETLLDSFMVAFFYICNACWISLQSQKALSYAPALESTLFGLLPLVFSTMAVRMVAMHFPNMPRWFAFTISLFFSMLLVGKSSYGNTFAIRRGVAKTHVVILIFAPAMCHVNTLSMYDFVLAYSLPFLLFLAAPMTANSPYMKLRAVKHNHPWLPYAAALVASVAFQQRYWIPFVHHWSMKILGAHASGLSLYLAMGSVAGVTAVWLWNKPNLLGEYHEDAIQILLVLAGVGLGKGSGLPWTMTPLPVLALLGITLWASTRMMRYLAIVLFVVHATSIVVFTYKFVGIQRGLVLPWGYELSLVRFGTVVTILSILIGTAMGLSVRPAGGFMGKTLRQLDVLGLLLIAYSVMLTIFEVTLYRQPIPTKELTGFMSEEDAQSDGTLYSHYMAFFTSSLMLLIIVFEQRRNSLYRWTSSLVASIAVGKSMAFWIDSTNDFQASDPRGMKLLVRISLATLLGVALLSPCVYLKPVHMKTLGRQRASRQQGLPEGSLQPIIIYCLLFLPLTILVAIPDVLVPAVSTLLSTYRTDAYYLVSTPISELVGGMISLWGLGSVIMLNHYLPDGGADGWKKVAALSFILGIGLMIAAPSIGLSFRPISHNPYASMSSLGSQLMQRSISRTGGFGFLLAATATLLALSGPLQLSEKRGPSGRQDKFILFRSMLFSLMFGGGVAWFATIQNMSDAHLLLLAITMISSLAISFLGTITAVFGHFIDIQNFEEVIEFSKLWLVAFAILLPVGFLPQFLLPSTIPVHAFGAGGWCSTYLGVSTVSALGVAILLRLRSSRNRSTRSLANAATVISFLCYSMNVLASCGIGSIETEDKILRVLHLPAPVSAGWIMLASPVLLILEGENSSSRGPRQNLQSPMRTKERIYGLSLPLLIPANRWFPMFFGVVSVLLASSLYAILFRGCRLFSWPFSYNSHTSEFWVKLLKSALNTDKSPKDIHRLVNLVVEQTDTQAMESHLDEASFWVSGNPIRPILHLAGLLSIYPGLQRLTDQYWRRIQVPSSNILLTLPFAAASFLLCSLPTLRLASAAVSLLSARQLCQSRNVESDRMKSSYGSL